MTIKVWPIGGDPTRLGEKAQGLIDLERMGLPVPPALILRGDALLEAGGSIDTFREMAIEQICHFLASLEGPPRTVSLRCAAKGRSARGRILPESVLDLGIREAIGDTGASKAVCTNHAAAFFAFFGHKAPDNFAHFSLRDQLDKLLTPLLAHLSVSPLLGLETPRTIVVQRMVYGDRDARSLTGICYTRHPHTGEQIEYGHFIVGRQGMSLGGADDPAQRDLSEMAQVNPVAHAALKAVFQQVEAYYGAVRQLEFTAEGDRLFLLQNTSGNTSFRFKDNT